MHAYYANDQDGSTPTTNIAWNHYVATYNSSVQSRYRYFNGNLLSPSQNSGVTSTSANRFFIGAFNEGTPHSYFQGKIALVRVYNRELSSTEILQNYNATKGRYGL